MIKIILMAALSPVSPISTPAENVQPCVWPNTCVSQPAPVQPCVWPNTCVQVASAGPIQACVWPNKCA